MASSGLLRLSSPRFQNFSYFPRARPLFVFHFTATSIPFSYCLTRGRSPVWATVSADSLFFVVLLLRRALALLDGAISGLVVFSK